MKAAQFSLRQLLTASLVCAIVFGIAAPVLRVLAPNKALGLAVAIAGWVAGFALGSIVSALRRRKSEDRAGELLFRFVATSRGLAVLYMALLAPTLIFACETPRQNVWSITSLVLNSLMYGLVEGFVVQNQFAFRECGIVFLGNQFFPYEQIQSFAWGRTRLILTIERAKTGEHVPQPDKHYIRIPSKKREAVASVLATHGVAGPRWSDAMAKEPRHFPILKWYRRKPGQSDGDKPSAGAATQ